MDKAKLSQILGHQLRGIMLHSDICKIALYHHNKKYAAMHYRQCLQETRNFLLTNEHIIDAYGMMVEPAKEAQFVVPVDATVSQLTDMWCKWEHETCEMYREAMEAEPECKWWRKLKNLTAQEIKSLKTF